MLAETYTNEITENRDNTIPIIKAQMGDWHFSLSRRRFENTELVGLYEHAAPDWEHTLDRLNIERAYRKIHQTDRASASNTLTARRVLDCGIGTGAFSTALIKAIPGKVDLYGIDLSPDMVERARNHFANLGVVAQLKIGDASSLPYPDHSFDLVMSAHMLEHTPEPQKVLAEMVRVLRPGGQILLCVTRKSLLGRHIQLKWRTHLLTPDRAAHWLENTGLTDVRILNIKNQPMFNRMSLVCVGQKPI